jgi:hypothetical protein
VCAVRGGHKKIEEDKKVPRRGVNAGRKVRGGKYSPRGAGVKEFIENRPHRPKIGVHH